MAWGLWAEELRDTEGEERTVEEMNRIVHTTLDMESYSTHPCMLDNIESSKVFHLCWKSVLKIVNMAG